jgi:phosphoribosyl-dephospho-CoA transferase
MILGTRPHKKTRTDILNTTRTCLKNDTTAVVSALTRGHQLHSELREIVGTWKDTTRNIHFYDE